MAEDEGEKGRVKLAVVPHRLFFAHRDQEKLITSSLLGFLKLRATDVTGQKSESSSPSPTNSTAGPQ